ncbi:hypothetical protein C8A03DRAFT_17900 [Achaetomium macrosporum]|uniref:Zn(2)-C6 fungal-type domain-containing protein n=1 Tax=Achaetomium macrosporum TaxID=79813 RepID=A0AAN7H531_9PEZI|nr:hypothetical protein C8A03DRAFT_17900 [Achaetomium macrosporum]
MVGVPGRSKACHTCRQRKIRCDGDLPSCRNCVNSRRVCTGYQRKRAFILSKDMVAAGAGDDSALASDRPSQLLLPDESDSGKVMVSRWRATDQSNKPHVPSSSAPSSASSRVSSSSRAASRAGTPGSKTFAQARPSPLLPPPEISVHNIFRDRIFALFAEHNLSATDAAPVSASDAVWQSFGERGDWMVRILNLPELTPSLEDSLLAAFIARLGRQTNRRALVRESQRLYARGLSAMRRDVNRKSTRANEQNLAACLALMLYEISECPGDSHDGYLVHYRGAMELMRIRGPAAHQSGLAHSVFQLLRLHSVFQNIIWCSTNFLAQPDWRDLPWGLHPESKTPFDFLLDILLDLPDLSVRRRALERRLEAKEDFRSSLLDGLECVREGQRMEAVLEAWYDRFKAVAPGALYHPELSQMDSVLDSPEMGKVFPVIFRFPNFIVGQNMLYYWIALMSVQAHWCFTYATLAQLSQTLDSVGRGNLVCTCAGVVGEAVTCLRHFAMHLLPPLGHREAWPTGAAYHVCQSIEYFMLRHARAFGPASVIPGLLLVKVYWMFAPGDMSREITWVNEMLCRVRAGGGSIAGPLMRLRIRGGVLTSVD